MAYAGRLLPKEVPFQALSIWKGRGFTSWSIWKGITKEICHYNIAVCERKDLKGLKDFEKDKNVPV